MDGSLGRIREEADMIDIQAALEQIEIAATLAQSILDELATLAAALQHEAA